MTTATAHEELSATWPEADAPQREMAVQIQLWLTAAAMDIKKAVNSIKPNPRWPRRYGFRLV